MSRLDLFVKENLPYFLKNCAFSPAERKALAKLPRSFWQKEIILGNIRLANKSVKPSINIDASKRSLLNINWQNIKNNWSFFYEKKLVPQKINLDLLKTSSDFLAFNKPAGLAVHPAFPLSRKSKRKPTLIEGIVHNYPEIAEIFEKGEEERPGVVHRLDKATTGVLLIARDIAAKQLFKKWFQERKIKKNYFALVEGTFPYDNSFTIAGLTGKTASNPLKRGLTNLRVNGVAQGRSVVLINPKTSFTEGIKIASGTLEEIAKILSGAPRAIFLQWKKLLLPQTDKQKKYFYSLLELRPLTGRTHQIRVHLSAVGFPVVGDSLYGSRKKLHADLHCLHSYQISWIDSANQKHKISSKKIILF